MSLPNHTCINSLYSRCVVITGYMVVDTNLSCMPRHRSLEDLRIIQLLKMTRIQITTIEYETVKLIDI